ncbi:hypothetical protein DL770_009141 [Monosporascus sp. CRB-9-2]|nr:hypothetical protein DL770_009141 [Monosporascus sp. CRB-9-2]
MLSSVVRSGRGFPRPRTPAEIFTAKPNMMRIASRDFRRHISAGSTVEPPNPPCVARIFDAFKYRDSTTPLNRSPKPEARYPASTVKQESRRTPSETSQSVPRRAGTSTTPAIPTTNSEQQAEEEVRGEEFWRALAPYKGNVIERKEKLIHFLAAVLPKEVPCSGSAVNLQSRDGFMRDVLEGMKESSMHVRLIVKDRFRLSNEKLDAAFTYFSTQEQLRDVVVSGGDAFYLEPHVLEMIGERLISLPNIKRFRFASRGLALSPHRFLDRDDKWTDALIRVSDKARKAGKHMALHTHFNHPNEISWVTEKASRRLHEAAVTVRNQTVLLRGVNDNVETMSTLLQKLADMVIEPYYVYQCDMVPKVEHLRTPLQTILDMEKQLRGSISGFCMPHFVVDLPGGGGKQLASTSSYDRESGISAFTAPALTRQGKAGKVYKYYDPVKPGGLVSEQGKNEVSTGKVLEAEGRC